MDDKILSKRSERDLSPSAYSQSSTGLEWDPSADVGTSANIQDEPIACTPMARSQIQFQKPTEGDNDKEQNHKEKVKRRDKSPPQPFAVASRRSSHRCHDAHHSRIGDQQLMSQSNDFVKETSASSSELSPSCFVIDKLVKTEKLPVKKDDSLTLSAVERHRDYHVLRVRKELRKLQKLNWLYSSRIMETYGVEYPKALQRPALREEQKRIEREEKQKNKNECALKGIPVEEIPRTPGTSHYMANTRSSSKRVTDTISGSSSSSYNVTDLETRRANQATLDMVKDTQEFIKIRMKAHGIEFEEDFSNKENLPNGTVKKTKKRGKRKKTPVKPVKAPVAYFINFTTSGNEYVIEEEGINVGKHTHNLELLEQVSNSEDEKEPKENNGKKLLVDEAKGKGRSTLQDAFQRRNPTFLTRVHDREEVLMRLKAEREVHAQKKREWIRKHGFNPFEGFNDLENSLQPKGLRLMTTKEMKDLTTKKYKTLPEVKNKILQKKAEEEKRTNRLMSQVFATKLRQGVLKGEMNIVHSRSLIRR